MKLEVSRVVKLDTLILVMLRVLKDVWMYSLYTATLVIIESANETIDK